VAKRAEAGETERTGRQGVREVVADDSCGVDLVGLDWKHLCWKAGMGK